MIDFKRLDFLKLFKIGVRILIGIIVLVLLIVFFGAPAQEVHQSRFDALLERGVLRVGVCGDMPKLGTEKNGKTTGLEADLAQQIAKNIFGSAGMPDLIPYDSKTKAYALDNGEVDLLLCRSTSAEFDQDEYIFSDPYFTDAVGFMARGGENMSLEDLSGKKVACIYGSDAQDAFVQEVQARKLTLEVYEYASYPEAVEALKKGVVSAFAEDTLVLFKYLPEGFGVSLDRFAPQDLRVIALKEDAELMDRVQQTLKALEETGGLDVLRKKWGL